jgi:serpin B
LPVVLAAWAAWPGSAASAAPSGKANAATSAPRADAAALRDTAAALGDLGLALLRDAPSPNAVVSPLAVATVLGMVQSGATGTTEHEIESLFGAGRAGAVAMRHSLPALSARMRAGTAAGPAPLRQAARLWIDSAVAKDVPAAFQRRLAQRHGADAVRVAFAEPEAARAQINRWTAEHTAGRVAELLGAGSLGRSTQITLTAAVHFRSAWERPFDAAATEPRPFKTAAGGEAAVPTLNDERAVAQTAVDGAQLYALPFASGFDLVLALPATAASGDTEALLKGLHGGGLARWHAALKAATPARCAFAMPKFAFAPRAGSIRPALERLGVKTAFTSRAELRPMLGRTAGGAHVDDVHHAAGMSIDEQGGEAVAAAAASIKPKTLAAPPPACAVDRAFVFAVMHRATGAPVFVGRVGDPARLE